MKLQFFFSPTEDLGGFHIDEAGACSEKYNRNIAAVGDLITLVESDFFIGEFNSNWGRLIRTMRMQLQDSIGGNNNSTVTLARERDMKVAWGKLYPGPPGW